jgi:L-lactate dehydrogenase complex protein LldG
MTNSRDEILARLREGREPGEGQDPPQQPARPFPQVAPLESYRPVVPRTRGTAALEGTTPAELKDRFVREAGKAGCVVYLPDSVTQAIDRIVELIGADQAISCWDLAQIPLPGLAAVLDGREIARLGQDATARVGLTGAQAALAATGSLVLTSGRGRYRAASLLPLVHIAVITAAQIIPDLESWWTQQRAAGLAQTRQSSNIVVITGPSRTADIAMQLVMGMHGPRELHVVLL